MMNDQNCIVCSRELHGRQTHFCSLECKNDFHQSYEAQQRRGLQRKLELVVLAADEFDGLAFELVEQHLQLVAVELAR